MTNENFQQLIELISNSSGIPVEELERRIEAKRAKLSWLISKEGAAQIIAAELGISFDKQMIKISQIVSGMRKVNIVGKIINLFPVREYNKNGRSGRIGSFVIADDTSNLRVVLWDENHIDLIIKGKIFEGCTIEINNASIRNGELHLTSFSEIKNSNQILEKVVTEKPVINKKIAEFNYNESIVTRAFIVNVFEPRFFEVCSECKKKINELGECEKHGKIVPEKRSLLNFIIDDGSDSIRAVLFSGQVGKIIDKTEMEDSEKFSAKKQELLGKEFLIYGQVRRNKIFNNNEIIIDDIQDVNLDELIKELEK